MTLSWLSPTLPLAERTRRRVSLYLIPYLFFLYVLSYLDRTNVAVAALGMMAPESEGGMGFDRAIIGFGAGMFFWGYWILEIPSSLSVLKWGARWVFVRILVLWGLSCALIGVIGMPFATSLFAWLPVIPEDAAVISTLDRGTDLAFGWLARLWNYTDPLTWFQDLARFFNQLPYDPINQFYFFRFMLGFFEGGFFPSVIVYLSLWFRAQDRAKAIASFMAAIPLSSLVGAPLSGLLLGVHWFGLPGWRWIFILQGIVPMLAGFATLFFLPDRPEKAAWLPPAERDWLVGELQQGQANPRQPHHWLWLRHVGVVALLTTAYFCYLMVIYGLGMFMPDIIKSQAHVSNFWASILTALPYLMALLGILINGWHSDRTGERIWHAAVPLLCLSGGIALTALFDGYGWLTVALTIFLVGTFLFATLPAYWPLPSLWLGALAAASATGFINMIGNLGGFAGPALVGKSATGMTTFAPALFKLAPLPAIAAVIILLVGLSRRQRLPSLKERG
ncbi:MAG: MFS transporter [Gemmataceae bacterium]